MFHKVDPSSYTEEQLTRELDRTKATVFMAKDAVFFGSIMCSLEFQWSRSIETACTNGIFMRWNPDFFMALTRETRATVLKHELWHVARMHMLRVGSRSQKEFNWACDIRINNDLENEKNSFVGIEQCWKDHTYDQDAKRLLSEEEIYDLIMTNQVPPPQGGSFGAGIDPDGEGDMEPLTSEEEHKVINTVVQAVQQAKLSGQAGSIPGDVGEVLKHFLEPVIPWQQLLMKFFTDMLDEDYTWARPNRRYPGMYLPSRFTDDGRLEHLVFFLDVSGSISDHDILRFNSEVKYIQEQLNPQKLTLVQFDTHIQKIDEFAADDPFDEIKVVGRGGTCLVPVRDFIEKHKPTAAVVFSDMWVAPMEPLTIDVPVIWAVYNNPRATVPFGQVVHIK